MDESNQAKVDHTDSSALDLEENEAGKIFVENSMEPEFYADHVEPKNEVITIVSHDTNDKVFIYERNVEHESSENSGNFVQVCDSNTFEVNHSEDKDVNVDGIEENKNYKIDSDDSNNIEIVEKENDSSKNDKRAIGNVNNSSDETVVNLKDGNEEVPCKNYKNVILEDWEVEVPQVVENHDSPNYIVVEEKPQEELCYTEESCIIEEIKEVETSGKVEEEPKKNSNELEILPEKSNENVERVTVIGDKKIEGLKPAKSISKDQIVKILDDSSDRVVRPIVRGKDIFFSIELTKRLNQKLAQNKPNAPDGAEKHKENDSCNNNNTVDDRQKIVDILEADEIKDWKSVPSKSDLAPKENGNDLEISKAIKNMEDTDSDPKKPVKTSKRTHLKRYRIMDRELERTIALQQLREEFSSTRKRSRTTKKVNHIPFLASTVLEKALNSPEVSTALKPGPLRRRPCYLPENTSKVEENVDTLKKGWDVEKSLSDFELGESVSTPVVKTYPVKRKSTDAESDIKTTLEAVAKALNESTADSEIKPKKQKTAAKENKKVLIKKKRKIKTVSGPEKKMNAELAKLLGDEGAVRMLYDTQHGSNATSPKKRTKFKTTTGLKKDLVLKTKLVKNAVMRLSGVATDGVFLRGKRRLKASTPEPNKQEEEPLFSSTPNIVFYKPKKKQRAEASRILYRHSSSESFDSLDGQKGATVYEDSVGTSNVKADDSNVVSTDTSKTPKKGRARKLEAGLKKNAQGKEKLTQKRTERLSSDSQSVTGSGLDLSIVPVRKSSRPRVASKKYSIWSSTSMDCLSVESLWLKKNKKASTELGKTLNCKEMTILDYERLVQIVLTPATTILKNSLNYDVLQELIQVLNYLSKKENCRVVLITSKGNTFCQGIDLNRIIAFSESEKKKGISQIIKATKEFVLLLANFKKPIIVGVQGAAIGLGVTLLPFCDLVICSDTASFQTPYVKLGHAPEGAATYTFPRISRQLVSELLFKSVKMTAGEALKCGLVSQVIPEEKFEDDLLMVARNMAAQPAEGLESIKSLLRKYDPEEIGKTLLIEGQMLEEQWNSISCLKNMIKFLHSGELQLRQFTDT